MFECTGGVHRIPKQGMNVANLEQHIGYVKKIELL